VRERELDCADEIQPGPEHDDGQKAGGTKGSDNVAVAAVVVAVAVALGGLLAALLPLTPSCSAYCSSHPLREYMSSHWQTLLSEQTQWLLRW
jgi:hypothetical protein